MSDAKALVVAGAQTQSVLAEYTTEQITALRSHVAPNFTDAELAYGLNVAKAIGLDPFAKQVYFTKRRQRQGDGWIERITVEPTIDGFRVKASRTGEMDGCEDPLWCGADGVWRDVWLEKEPPKAAKVTVYRRNHRKHYSAVARFDEYAQRNRDNGLTQMWQKMPGAMLAKCAEALALRRAFPETLGGIYSHEEMMQADREDRDQLPPERQPERVTGTVVNMPTPPKLEAARAAVEQTRKTKPADGIPKVWTPTQPIPATLLLALPGITDLTMPVSEMTVEQLEAVVEVCAHTYERWKEDPKRTEKALNLVNKIGAAASAVHYDRTNNGGSAA